MRSSIRMSIIALLLTFGLASFATAQMMNSNHNQQAKTDSTASTQTGMMGNHGMMNGSTNSNMKGNMNANMTPEEMTQQREMMMADFNKLQERIGVMMKTDDMKTLKSDLQNLQTMVMGMRENMNKNMMGNMGANGHMGANYAHNRSGSMGMNSQGSSTHKQHTQSH